MAKNLSGSFTTIGLGQYAKIGSQILDDGSPTNAHALNRFMSEICSQRSKAHVSRAWAPSGTHPQLQSTSVGAWEDVLEFRITPRQHVGVLRVKCNANTNGNTGSVRITTPTAAPLTLVFTGAYTIATELTGTVTCTSTAGQLVTVAINNTGTSTLTDIRSLWIADEPIANASMP